MSGHTPGPHTVKHRPGRKLTGADAEIAEMQDCEPYELGSVLIPETNFECIYDGRDAGREERALADGTLYAAAPETAAELERANARIEELVNVLTIISTANVPINRNDFPRAFDTLRAIAQDALANATPDTAQQIEHETKSYDAGNRDGKATMRERAAKLADRAATSFGGCPPYEPQGAVAFRELAKRIRSLPLDPDCATGEKTDG